MVCRVEVCSAFVPLQLECCMPYVCAIMKKQRKIMSSGLSSGLCSRSCARVELCEAPGLKDDAALMVVGVERGRLRLSMSGARWAELGCLGLLRLSKWRERLAPIRSGNLTLILTLIPS